MKMIAEHQTNLCRHCKMQREADMIKIENVSKNFRRHKAIKGFTCELDKGCYGLLGPNGAGKTTLLRCILGLYPVSEGVVSLQKGEQIGYLPQRFGMFHELKVKEMMYYFAAAKKVSKEKREAEIERVLADVNLSEKAEEKVGHLSGGMQRRLGIAQAILGDPDILFLDSLIHNQVYLFSTQQDICRSPCRTQVPAADSLKTTKALPAKQPQSPRNGAICRRTSQRP